MTVPASRDPPEPDYLLVDTPEALAAAARKMEKAKALAVDTEADSMHSYFEKVCLLQVATDAGEAFLIDPLALDGMEPLRKPFANPKIAKIFHGADFDVVGLHRDFGFEFAGVFDTMVAAQLVGDEKLSLRDLVTRFFGIQLEKAYTRSDWGKRPLSPQQLAYCYYDVAFLVELMGIQQARLAELDLLAEAAIEFQRLEERRSAAREFDRHGWIRIKGSKDISPQQQSVLAELFLARDRHARNLDRPVFKVIGNDTLLRIARAAPGSVSALRRQKGVSSYVVGRMARDILKAVEKGQQRGAPPPRPRIRPEPEKRLGQSGQKRLGRLRDWRNEASERSGLTTMAILPNHAMFEVARTNPRTLEALGEVPGVGARRTERWGREILERMG